MNSSVQVGSIWREDKLLVGVWSRACVASPWLGTAGFACAPILLGFNPVLDRDLCCVTLWCNTWVLAMPVWLEPASLLHAG